MPTKSIAIPSRLKAGGKSSRAPKASAVEVPVRRRVPAPANRATPTHRFAVGELVTVTQPSRLSVPQAGRYRILRHLPYEGGTLMYRVQSEADIYERVVAEGDISLPETVAGSELP